MLHHSYHKFLLSIIDVGVSKVGKDSFLKKIKKNLEIWGSGDVILAKNQPNRLRNTQMATSAREASLTAFACDLGAIQL